MGLAVLAGPITRLLFPRTEGAAAQLMMLGVITIILNGNSNISNGVLQGIGKPNIPMILSLIHIFALIILDVMMPKMDGWEVCREVRKNSKVPIIMLTARGDERDELLGFDLGVDEYISKPFSPKILVARVEAILRRTGQTGAEDVLSAGGIVIDKAAHLATVDDKPMDLSFKEFELLTYFLENQGIRCV